MGPANSPTPAGFLIGIPRVAYMASARFMRRWSSSKARLDVSTIASTARSSTWMSPKTGSRGKGVRGNKETFYSKGSTREKLPAMCILQGRHCAFVSHHDACDGHLDVSRCTIGPVGRVSQIAAEPRFEGAGRQEVFGLIIKISETALKYSGTNDLSVEPLVVNLKEEETIAKIAKIEAKRETIVEQDSFKSRSIR